jgi:putative aldouronate transport system substrate-binding protein
MKESSMSLSRRTLLGGAAALGGTAALAACQPKAPISAGGGDTAGGESLAYLPSNQPSGWSTVISKVNEKMAADIDTTLNAQFLNWSQYAQQVLLKFTAKETFDSALNARWMNMVQLVSAGSLADLTDEIGSYENLSAQLDDQLIESNKWNGKLWGIPQVNGAARITTFSYRRDLADEELTDFDSFLKFLSDVKQKNSDIVPLELHNNVGMGTALQYSPSAWENPMPLAQSFGTFSFTINPDDPTDIKPSYEDEAYVEGLRTLRELGEKGLINNDVLSLDSAAAMSQFASGRFAAQGAITDGLASTAVAGLFKNVEGAELAMVLPFKDGLDTKPYQTFQADNFAVLNPAGDVDRALKIQDWLSIQENHDLLAYGVEGTDWEAVGDDKYKALSDYSFPGFSILWRLDLERKADTISESEEEIFEWSKVYDNFTIDPLATFYPDVAPVEAEEAELTNVVTEYIKPIAAGTVDVDKGLDKVKKAAEKAGIEKVMEEMKSQISEYLKTQG